ncbi:UPF0235 protein C15orf40 homolog [Candoia aspera]|uniref:UPF0235 protein C15orf40 homolog n=1 Tax=Candoia aspera TaxID=51853 RepID=UPI002FD838C4
MLGRALPAFRRSGLPVWAAAGRGLAMPRKGKAQTKDLVKPSVPPVPVATDKSGSVIISVHAKPGSKQNAVTDLTNDAVSVAIAAPPSEGEANTELCRYLSKVLEVKKSDVVLEKGSKSREKVVKILAPLTPEDVLEKLRKEISS